MSNVPDNKESETRWAKVQELFGQAIELPVAEQAAFARQASAGDELLYEELVSLLATDQQLGHGPLTDALGAAAKDTTRDRRYALVGSIVGAYKLISPIGFGGAGTVYLAERADRQYSGQVAIKIVESAALHADVSLRFRAERQILASLNHPNIARLIDAGETQQGCPYLVMEYIQGESIDRYCDRVKLDIQGRVRLFLDVCAAVQYAHQNLIVHRDLKPPNILVTPEGSPKLLDFGIAKLLDTRATAAALALTRMNDRVLTPEYASPEQILGRPVTTASDVYALGVVLYELLTGVPPYVISDVSQLELERSICTVDPLKPSAVWLSNAAPMSRSTITPEFIAASRQTSIARLPRILSGDLDAIILRALRKEPELRYTSAEALAADLRRYLESEPVIARQGNWVYHSRRFARKHAFGVGAGAAFILLLSGFTVVTSLQAHRISLQAKRVAEERDRAEQVSTFMAGVFTAADPYSAQGHDVTARELLDQASRRIDGDLIRQPQMRAQLLETIGHAYHRLGYYDKAVGYLRESVHLQENEAQTPNSHLALTLSRLATALRHQGDFDASETAFKDSLRLLRNSQQEKTMEYAELLSELGRLQQIRANIDSARLYFEQSLALMRELRGTTAPESAVVLGELATLAIWKNELPVAEKLIRSAVQIDASTLPELHPDRVVAERILGDVLSRMGRIDEAGSILERVLEKQRLLYGGESAQLGVTMEALLGVRMGQHRFVEAEKLAREALESSKKLLGGDHYQTGYFQTSLAAALAKQGKYAEAEAQVNEAMSIFEKTLPADHQYVAAAEHQLGEIYVATGRATDAETVLKAALGRWQRAHAATWLVARSESVLGEALFLEGHRDQAEKLMTMGYQTLVSEKGAQDPATQSARDRLDRVRAKSNTQALHAAD